MSSSPLDIEGVVRASALERSGDAQTKAWSPEIVSGRLAEISGEADAASLTMAFELVRECQRDGEPVAWVSCQGEAFYPPDVQRNGIDLEALPVVRLQSVKDAGRAADRLVRSGGFGLVVVDLGQGGASPPDPLQKRLLNHAEREDAGVVFVTRKSAEQPSLGAMVSFRGQTRRRRLEDDRFECGIESLADKRWGPGWRADVVCQGPPGLR